MFGQLSCSVIVVEKMTICPHIIIIEGAFQLRLTACETKKKLTVKEGYDFVCSILFILTEKGNIDSMKLTGSQIGKQAAAKSKGLFSAEDWMCSKCVHNQSALF